MDELERRLVELREREELDSIRPQLDGIAVMEHLGIAPSRDVGAALDFLLQIRLDEGIRGGGDPATPRRLVEGAVTTQSSRRDPRPRCLPASRAGVQRSRVPISARRTFTVRARRRAHDKLGFEADGPMLMRRASHLFEEQFSRGNAELVLRLAD